MRLDTIFSDKKQNSVKFVENGGWHFSNLKTHKDLEKKYLNDENHAEYELKRFIKFIYKEFVFIIFIEKFFRFNYVIYMLLSKIFVFKMI